eukprot:COSAG06_NODE_7370_length_2526_cov_14.737948_2_plen_323_part_01
MSSWNGVELRARELLRLAHRVSDLANEVDASLSQQMAAGRPHRSRYADAARRPEARWSKEARARATPPPASAAGTTREDEELEAKRQQAASAIGAAARGRRQRAKYNHATATPIDKQLVRARQVFTALDDDGNGVLTGDELTKLANWVFESFHPGDVPLSQEERESEASKLLSRLDDNGDGVLEFDEFADWFRRTVDSITSFRQRQGETGQDQGATTDELLTVLASSVHEKRMRRQQQHQAASTIERAARGRRERKRAAAAEKIEAAARGRRERKEQAKRQQAASAIGAAARGRRQRAKYNHATATPIDKQLVRARQVFTALD